MAGKRTRSAIVGVLVTILGVGLLAVSAFITGWPRDLLVNVGSACLLAIPLVWVERQLERSERRTQEAVGDLRTEVADTKAEVRQSLADITARVAQAESDREDERRKAVDAIAEAPSQETIRRALAFSTQEQAASVLGVRVRLHPSVAVYVRFAISGPDLMVGVERRDGESVGPVFGWGSEESTADFLLRLSDLLGSESLHPGASFDGGRPVLAALADALRTARTVKRRFQLIDKISDVIEICGDQWMICDWGICGWHEPPQPYAIEAHRLEETDWLRHMGEKDWVDVDQFRYALETARLLKSAGRLPG